MGFYGNVTKTSLTFDKIYANRYEMDQAVQSPEGDGIYVGRFVLVDYNKGVPAHNYTRVYQHGYEGFDNNFYFSADVDDDDTTRAGYSTEYYYNEDGTINDKRDDIEYQFYLFIGQIVYTFNEKDKSYKFYITKEATDTKWAKLEEIQTPVDVEPYFENFIIDRKQYGDNIGRGYDSTVWQKVYIDNQEKYVMLAELNSVVPTFGVTVDAPTINPIKPHFDADTTNIYYKLHVQPSWGLRVKELTEDDGYLSDQTASSDEINWDPFLKKPVNMGKSKYDAAIYYNKKGFDSEKRYEREQPKELITIKDTGSSGQSYNVHSTIHSGVTKTEPANDIQELVIQLPSIGNTISDLWNIIYGYGDLVEDANGIKTYRRNKNIAWDSIAGDRLVTENPNGSGFNYNPKKVETVAGCINSIHDLMGMIITDEQKDVDNALMNRIYYGDYRENPTVEGSYKGYYIKELSYTINPDKIITKEDIEALKVQDMLEFSKNKYYYINNSNYYLETNKYNSGNKYYELKENDIVPVSFYDKDYEPNKFYYEDGGNFKLSATTYADPNKKYYYTESEIKTKNIIDNSKDTRFFPTNKVYFDKYFNSTPFEELRDVEGSEGTLKRGDGWFYWDKAESLYKPFTYIEDRQYIQYLRYVTNFLVEQSIDVQTGEKRWVYDLEKGANQIEYTTFEFKPDTYYYYQPNEENEELPGSYILLTSEEEIDLEKIYISFPEDKDQFKLIEEQFYIPDAYYYKEGNDYLFGIEDKRRMDKDYFLIDGASEVQGTFYEPYKYYYVLHDEYVLDTNDKPTSERDYYREGVHYYVLEDPRGILKPYSKLNAALVGKLPDSVKYGPREEIYKWRELEGFSRTLNSIHGMLLELNRIIRFEDKVTRDERTLAGTLNKINDVLTTIGKLTPGQIVVTDNYGRMTTADSNATQEVKSTKTEYDYQSETFVNTETVIDDKGSWVGFEVTLNEEDVTTDIAFGHKYNPVISTKKDTDMNAVGDVFGLVRPVVDNMGHIVAMDNENIKLPNGYKSIETDNGEPNKIEAQNSKDIFILKGDDSWLSSTASVIENKAQIEFAHLYPNQTANIFAEVDMNSISSDNITEEEKVNKENKIVLESVNLDETGHVTNKNFDTITLPYGYKHIRAEGEENNIITAENTQDTFSLIGDKNEENNQWIKTSILSEEKGIKIEHNAPSEVQSRNLNNLTPKFGDSFEIEDWVFDSKGHQANVSTHSISIPKGDLIEKEVGARPTELNAIANVEFKPETGVITLTRKDINDFKLKPIDENISQTLTGKIDFTENLGQALYKLQQQLDVLNGNGEIEGSVDNKVQVLKESVDNKVEELKETVDEKIEIIEKEIESIFNNSDENLNSLNEISGWIEEIAEQNFLDLNQADITLNSRCNVLDKEVKDLINIVAPYEEKIKYLDEKIKYLEDKIKALTNE